MLSVTSEAFSPSEAAPTGYGRTKLLSALGLLLVLAVEGAWAYSEREGLSYAPTALAALPLGLVMVSSAVVVLLVIHLAFSPALRGLRRALRDRLALAAGLVALALYVPAFLFGQDALQRVALGPLFRVSSEGAPGFTPIFIIFPVRGTGIVVASYQVAVMGSLGLLLGLNVAAFLYLLRRGRYAWGSAGLGAGGAGLGLLVWCPTCIAPPVIAFLSTYLLPILSLTPTAQSVTVATIYLLSLLVLLIALEASARALSGNQVCRLERG